LNKFAPPLNIPIPPLPLPPQILLGEIIQAQRPNIAYSHSFVELRPKMMMMVMIIMGHECVWGLSGGGLMGEEGERKRNLGVKKMEVHRIYTYEDSIMKLTKHCLKERGRERWNGT
jgi:hypothetical protein